MLCLTCTTQSSTFHRSAAQGLSRDPAHLALIQWGVLRLPEDHTEGDALGVGGEDPADGEACLGHGDGDEAVGAGSHEQLPGTLPEAGDLLRGEG